MSQNLDFRPMQPTLSDLHLFRDCFRREGQERSLEALRWQYLENPTGHLFVDFAIASGEVVAIYATIPQYFRVRGTRMLSLQSVDTLTDARFRGRGLFPKMGRRIYNRAAQAGVDLVYGFPNDKIVEGRVSKLNWILLDPVPFLIRPLGTSYLLRKLTRGRLSWNIQIPAWERTNDAVETMVFPTGVGQLWDCLVDNHPVALDRTDTYLKWRFSRPGREYNFVYIISAGKISAFCAYCVEKKHGGIVGYIVEFLRAPDQAAAGRNILGRALRRMLEGGAEVVLAWCMTHDTVFRDFVLQGFLPFPERLRPIELHLGVLPLSNAAKAVVHRRLWRLSYCDSDTV